jgi:copper chaperone CopZ
LSADMAPLVLAVLEVEVELELVEVAVDMPVAEAAAVEPAVPSAGEPGARLAAAPLAMFL